MKATWSVGSAVAIGAIVGSVVPGAGTVLGAIGGFVAGTMLSFASDVIVRTKWFEKGEKSIMDYAKEGANKIVDKIGDGIKNIGNSFSKGFEAVFC